MFIFLGAVIYIVIGLGTTFYASKEGYVDKETALLAGMFWPLLMPIAVLFTLFEWAFEKGKE